MFTNFLDTRFPVDVEIEEPILQGKTVFIRKEVVSGTARQARRG
jgi:hypothetical protein